MSQFKVITVVFAITVPMNHSLKEIQYPELNTLLEDGYNILESLLSPKHDGQVGAITFVLNKP